MKWIPDNTGRFSQRPYYEREELDFECENLVTTFFKNKYGRLAYPLSTNDLTILIEQHTSDLDLYADLSTEGTDVEGVTDFFASHKPTVRISNALQEPRLENRLRSTLTHELGHVKFHDSLWVHHQMSLFETNTQDHSPRCKRETILGASQVDWLEWQAGYISGALLMPITVFRQIAMSAIGKSGAYSPILVNTSAGRQLVSAIATNFQVSANAACVRLLQLGYLTEQPPQNRLL